MPTGGPTELVVRSLPGTGTSCALLTVLTILLAWPSPPPELAVLVRPCYFALLSWFFWRTTRASPALQGQPMRLVRGGFLILFLAFTISALIHFVGIGGEAGLLDYLRQVCESGALFLLGTTLTAYGLMLWIPQVLASNQLLAEHSAAQRFALQDSESARSRLEHHLVDADRRGMLGELAASIAHDLRNPLTIVKGTAESLCRKQRTRAEIAEHTQVIQRNIDKADHTIDALIALARPRAQEPEDLDAMAVLADVADLLHVEARRRRVALDVVGAPGSTVVVRTDRTLVTQALLNLVLNAVQATGDGGSVRLVARAVPRRGRTAVAFAIEDRGHGLPPDVRARVFTPFFTTKATGTGLGLSSCRRIAGELRGSLKLYPRRRGGARSLLLLPARPEVDSPATALRADEPAAWAATNC